MTIEKPASKTTRDRINLLAKRIFRVNSKRAALKAKHREAQNRLKASYEAEDNKLKVQFDKDTTELAILVRDQKDRLVEPGKQSFVTLFARFGFRRTTTETKFVDKDVVEKLVRKLGITKQVATRRVVVTYDVELDRLEALLERRPELKPRFDGLILWASEKEKLNVKPNEAYFTQHDSARLSEKAIPLPDAD